MALSAADQAYNDKQKAFDAANPVGTAIGALKPVSPFPAANPATVAGAPTTPGVSTSTSTAVPGNAAANAGATPGAGASGTHPVGSTPAAVGSTPATVTPKPTVATVDNPVVVRGVPPATAAATPAAAASGASDYDKYLALTSKDPAQYTDADKSFLRTLSAKSTLMGGLPNALGMAGDMTTDDMGLKVRFSLDDSGNIRYTDSNGIERNPSAQEKETLLRSPQGSSIRAMQEAKRQAAQALSDKQESDKKIMEPWQKAIDAAHQSALSEIQAQGKKRLDSMQNSFSASGFGRSTAAAEGVDSVQRSIQQQVEQESQLYESKVAAKAAEMQGADSAAMKPYYDRINKINNDLAESTATAFTQMQGLNAKANLSSGEALQNLLSTFTTAAQADLKMAGFDKEESAKLGYFAKKDKYGNVVPMLDKNGEPIQFKKQSEVKSSASINLPNGTIGTRVTYMDGRTETLDASGKVIGSSGGMTSGASAAPTGAATAGNASVPQTGFTEKLNLSRTGTNVAADTNNPGNITADSIPAGMTKSAYGAKIGATGTYLSPNGREYFVFPTAQSGQDALEADIKAKQSGATQSAALKSPDATLGDYLRVHTGSVQPEGSGYAQTVMAGTQSDLSVKFRDIDPKALASSIANAEGVASVSTSPTAPAANSGKYVSELPDQYMEQAAVNLAADPKFKLPKGMDSVTVTARANAIKAALKSGDASHDDDIAKMVAGYALDTKALNVYRKEPERWASIVAKAQEINPNFEESKYDANLKAAKDYTPGGKVGGALNSLSMVMGHLTNYLDAINKYNFDTPLIGKKLNDWTTDAGQAMGGTAKTVLAPIQSNVGEETAKFLGGGTSDAEGRKQHKEEVSITATPTQAKAFVQTQLGQFGAKSRAYNEAYKEMTGHYYQGLISETAKDDIRKMAAKYGIEVKISDLTGDPADDEGGAPDAPAKKSSETPSGAGATSNPDGLEIPGYLMKGL